MQFNTLYSGRDSAAKFPELDALERSTQRASELQVRGAEMKLEKALKDKDKFQKMLEIDPVVAVSSANAARQASRLQEYNTKWAKKYADSKGELSFADEVEMSNDKKLLQAEQGKILADQEQLKNLQSVLQKDTEGYYDRKILQDGINRYYETGELDPNILVVAPQDINKLLAKDPAQTRQTRSYQIDVTDPKTGNKVGVQNVSEEGMRTEEEAKEQIFQKLKHEPVLRFVVEDFLAQDDAETAKFLKEYDRDGNMRIDPQEMQYVTRGMNVRDNPIVQWAMNNPKYLSTSMGVNPSVPRNPQSTGGKKGGFSINFGGQQMEVSPGYKRNGTAAYGDKVYYNAYAFPSKISLANIPTQNGIAFIGKRSRKIPAGNVQGYLKDYIADEDILIVEPTKGYENFGIDPGGLIGIPASNIEGTDNLPIKGENGQMTTIGVLRGEKATKGSTKKVDIGL